MEPSPQVLALILGSTVVGGVVMKLIDWARDGIAGRATRRRSEVDRALQDRDAAKSETATAKAETVAAEKLADREAAAKRAAVESIHEHRIKIIRAPCLGPDHLPPFPTILKEQS